MLTRWPTRNPLHQLHEEMNRLFDRWTDGGRVPGSVASYPPVNVWEDHECVIIEAELPGFDLKDIDITISGGNTLTVRGERKPPTAEKAVWHRHERSHGKFSRSLALPFPVDADKVDARLDHGILTMRLAKHESAKPRKILVRGE